MVPSALFGALLFYFGEEKYDEIENGCLVATLSSFFCIALACTQLDRLRLNCNKRRQADRRMNCRERKRNAESQKKKKKKLNSIEQSLFFINQFSLSLFLAAVLRIRFSCSFGSRENCTARTQNGR